MCFFFFQAEDGIRDLVRSRGLGDVYKRQGLETALAAELHLKLPVGEWIKSEPQLGDEDILKRLSLIHI